MDAVSSSIVTNATNADLGTVQGDASIAVLKKARNQQAADAVQLIQALPQPEPSLATSGALGTKLNMFA